jgi:hypothetical protein
MFLRSRHGGWILVLAGLLWFPTLILATSLWSSETRQRLSVGIKLLPACLAADQALEQRQTPTGELRILVVYQEDPAAAAAVAERLRHQPPIRRLPPPGGAPLAGLLLAEPGLPPLSGLARELKTLVFSPFVGDVERGAVAGIHVSERILPYVNLAQARRAGIRFKPFFLEVAQTYD